MTVNELIGKIELRIREIGDMPINTPRIMHPDAIGDTRASALDTTRNKPRHILIADIIVGEFSLDNDVEIPTGDLVREYQHLCRKVEHGCTDMTCPLCDK